MIKASLPSQVLKPLVLFYALLSIVYWIFILAPGSGDEGLMSLYLSEGNNEGYYWLIQKGNFSLPYSLLVYPLSFIFPSYFALRILSLAGVIFLYFYLKRRLNFKSQNFKNHIIFYLSSGSFLLGTNDCPFYNQEEIWKDSDLSRKIDLPEHQTQRNGFF